ncbi:MULTISPECIES: ring-opening amidohydrolase [Ramlibacter]|uniref:Cyclic amide hydrolase n=1 Tax=Ramlibacter pinisoli TaxID=2682844 RepID=A0A6N8IPY4_9BURK|nr:MULTISPECIES: ring-opening amidohydrolase [Ramlibacter]MBA2960562.1 ring-opening amidohydrolase [Ramlibacter sp. CGMCC 1.13660]MVQ27893.1 ring-opening amidohydrolase [Ramlibacter pinisoli]
MQAAVHRLSMRHPGDVSELEALFHAGALRPADVVAVIGKTEGNGGVNDFTRGYFTQSLLALLARRTGEDAAALAGRIPCVLSGGCEGVLSPHYLVFSRRGEAAGGDGPPALAIGVAMSEPLQPEDIGRGGHIRSVAAAVRRAMADARIASPADVQLVQVKCPTVTVAGAQDAAARGRTVVSQDPNRAMAHARVAGAFGVAQALGELDHDAEALSLAGLADFGQYSDKASISSGVEVRCNEVIVLGASRAWRGPLRIACRPMRDALDIGAVYDTCRDLGLELRQHQLTPAARARVAGVLVKCEPDRRGSVRGQRHTMLDDTDINAQRHIRGAVGGLVAGVLGDGRLFVSGGAEHQGPDGGGLVAVIAEALA